MKTVRRQFWCQFPVLLLAAMAATAQVGTSAQNGQQPASPPASATPAQGHETPTIPGVTVTGKVPRAPLPKLGPNDFKNCMDEGISRGDMDLMESTGDHTALFERMKTCDFQRDVERYTVLTTCTDRSGKTVPPMLIRACTESLKHKLLPDNQLFFLFVSRAEAYLAEGDRQHAFDDYNEAIKSAPRFAALYYDRGLLYAERSDQDAALRDFDTAIGIDPKLVPALLQRAKIYRIRGNFSGALADDSAALLLQPTNAALWSERGYAYLRQHDYPRAINDEAEAIRLDPKLARAYFFRGAAFGELHDAQHAASDINTALRLDPSLNSHLATQGKAVSLTLPLPP